MQDIFIFFTVTFIAALSPGPAVLLSIKNGANYGLRFALFGILGNISAVFIWSTVSIMGIGLLLKSSIGFLFWSKIIGGFYLMFLGGKSFRSMPRDLSNIKTDKSQVSKQLVKLYIESLLIGLSNPKAIFFFAALFPQFIGQKGIELMGFITLVIGCVVCSGSSLMIYALFAAKFRQALTRNSKVTIWFNYIIASVFIVFGGVMLSSA